MNIETLRKYATVDAAIVRHATVRWIKDDVERVGVFRRIPTNPNGEVEDSMVTITLAEGLASDIDIPIRWFAENFTSWFAEN